MPKYTRKFKTLSFTIKIITWKPGNFVFYTMTCISSRNKRSHSSPSILDHDLNRFLESRNL